MSTTFPDDRVAAPSAPHAPRSASRWVREPLVHFALAGAILFALDSFLLSRADDPRTIVVSAAVDAQAKALFKERRGVEPNAAELEALRRVWLDNEVLYRGGLALQVHRGDDAIRERVIFKALSVVDAGVKLPPFDDATLRKWFEANRVKYDEPARYDFLEAVLYGDSSESSVREFVDLLNKGVQGDAKAGLRVFKGRPYSNLVESYGDAFAKSLGEAPVGQWRAQWTREGWRAIRLESIAPARPASFEQLRGVVKHDWTDAVLAEQRTAAVRALAKRYTIRYEGDAK